MIANTFSAPSKNVVSWEELQQLVITELQLKPKQRLLQLQCYHYPFIKTILSTHDVSYFGFEKNENVLVPQFQKYRHYVKKRKLLLGLLQEHQIPYVQRFFHHIISMNPSLPNEQSLYDHLTETYRVLGDQGTMALWMAQDSYQEILATVEIVKNSDFTIDDLKVLSVQTEAMTARSSVLFILKKPTKPEVPKTKVLIMTKPFFG